MQRPLLLAAIAAVALLLLWMIFVWEPVPTDSIAEAPTHARLDLAAPPTGGDFRLDSPNGPVDTARLRGKVVLIYFGYTWCPDICPTNLALIAYALRTLTPAELERVAALFVSVDPERDTPERLAEYAAYFHPAIVGVTGSPEAVAQAARQYGAAYRRIAAGDSAMGYLVDHSAYTYVVDPAGRLARTLEHATPPEAIAETIRELLQAE